MSMTGLLKKIHIEIAAERIDLEMESQVQLYKNLKDDVALDHTLRNAGLLISKVPSSLQESLKKCSMLR